MPEYRILLVEDEKELASTILLNLQMEGYVVVHSVDGLAALEKLRAQAFDLVILDIMLPHLDGLGVCETMRVEGIQTPVLFLSAKASGAERVEGLKIGGDDYLTKPFHLEELLLRVKKLIMRKGQGDSLSDVVEFEFGGNKVNFNTFEICDHLGETRVISKKEIMLLRLLLQRKDQVVSREEILEKICGYDVFPTTRTIDNYILAFRKYFESDSRQPRYFHSVRGVGYRFTPGG
ncbi:MAG: response regulator transcription factor [Flavobacteriales bacterium]|nr:response regulator transcription factor [Flavobacteriales bacterium]